MSIKLSTADRRSLTAARNVLARLGVDFPTAVRVATPVVPFTLTKHEIKRFINALSVNKIVVATINGPAKQFQIMTIESYLNRRTHAQRMTRNRLNKKS